LCLQDNADLIQLSETRDPHLKQPFICCMGTMETPTNFWIVIDRDIILLSLIVSSCAMMFIFKLRCSKNANTVVLFCSPVLYNNKLGFL
jgi:hypothetical protein